MPAGHAGDFQFATVAHAHAAHLLIQELVNGSVQLVLDQREVLRVVGAADAQR